MSENINVNNKLLQIIKYIDFCYINNYLKNNFKLNSNNSNDSMNNWKIFSTYSNDDKYNILYLIQMICSQNVFDHETLIISIYIYKKICIKYAHLIDNYVYLFGTIYIVMNKFYCINYLNDDFLIKILNIEPKIIKIMITCIENFLIDYEIYFGNVEKNNIFNEIIKLS